MTSHRVWRSFLALLYDFGLWKRSETDSTKIVSYTASAAGVCVDRVAYEDIRQAFGLPGVSNELLRARANARVTNKKALSEIATSLLEGVEWVGCAKGRLGSKAVTRSRSASKRRLL